mmetsp:Transcript_18168/g.34969  ORF Transcript_18168/g.34969 Transcript_18168/m.34969 type:complete len:479 (-) Transcript_18168:268-1704(-)
MARVWGHTHCLHKLSFAALCLFTWPSVSSSEAPQLPITVNELSLDQLAQLAALQLQLEDGRPAEKFLSLAEFDHVSSFDCASRLVYLINETLTVQGHIQTYQRDFLGGQEIFGKLLQSVPQENTWIWLLMSVCERFSQQVHTYLSRVVALALDQHHCLVSKIRDVILTAVGRWKKLYAELLALQWDDCAFGVDGVSDNFSRSTKAVGGLSLGGSVNGNLSQAFIVGNRWIESMHHWFDQYAQDLVGAAVSMQEGQHVQSTGATRLHHQDEHGSFVTYELMRRNVFGQWAIDKGLLRGLLRNVWQPPCGAGDPVTVADFGAGGGHYSTWMNETGLVQAFAFDGTQDVARLTNGSVQEVNLVQEMRLWRNFSWVLCLEVGEHIPPQFASGLLANIRHHAQEGIVMSWSSDWEGIGHVNCLSREDFIAKVENETGFVFDNSATEAVRASCEIEYIARSIAVFRGQAHTKLQKTFETTLDPL